jgi:hypothetical protein
VEIAELRELISISTDVLKYFAPAGMEKVVPLEKLPPEM